VALRLGGNPALEAGLGWPRCASALPERRAMLLSPGTADRIVVNEHQGRIRTGRLPRGAAVCSVARQAETDRSLGSGRRRLIGSTVQFQIRDASRRRGPARALASSDADAKSACCSALVAVRRLFVRDYLGGPHFHDGGGWSTDGRVHPSGGRGSGAGVGPVGARNTSWASRRIRSPCSRTDSTPGNITRISWLKVVAAPSRLAAVSWPNADRGEERDPWASPNRLDPSPRPTIE